MGKPASLFPRFKISHLATACKVALIKGKFKTSKSSLPPKCLNAYVPEKNFRDTSFMSSFLFLQE